MFDDMINQIQLEVTKIMLHVVKADKNLKRSSAASITGESLDNSAINSMNAVGESNIPNSASSTEKAQPIVNDGPKVGRNEPCPCRKPVRNIKIVVVSDKKYGKPCDLPRKLQAALFRCRAITK